MPIAATSGHEWRERPPDRVLERSPEKIRRILRRRRGLFDRLKQEWNRVLVLDLHSYWLLGVANFIYEPDGSVHAMRLTPGKRGAAENSARAHCKEYRVQ